MKSIKKNLSVIVVTGLTFLSSHTLAYDSEKIKQLEARIKALESQSGLSNGLKVKDLSGKTSNSMRSPLSIDQPNIKITEQQRKEIENSLNQYKARQKEARDYLEEMERLGDI